MEINNEIFNSFPELRTQRLLLRQLNDEDAETVFALRTNHAVNRFIYRPAMQEVHLAGELIQKTKEAFTQKAGIAWAAQLRDEPGIIGACGFHRIDHPNLRAEIGGEMLPGYWGKNIAFEAVKAIVDFGFTQMNLHSIEAKMLPANRGAIYLLEQLGFVKEAHLKDYIFYNNSFHDFTIYSMINPRHLPTMQPE